MPTIVANHPSSPETSPRLMQRLSALQRANAVRCHRAQIKRELAAGAVTLAEVMNRADPDLASMPIVELLLACPKVGRVKARRALAAAGTLGRPLSPSRPLSSLNERQRTTLLGFLPDGDPTAGQTAEMAQINGSEKR